MNKLNIVFSMVILLFINNCGGNDSSDKTDVDQNTSTEPTTITHNGTTYGMITSPNTGKVWLDKNLGAARVCQSFNDTACYGDYYQWGRNYDGHQDSSSNITTQQILDINNTGNEFVLDSGQYRNDWAYESDKNGDRRMERISSHDGSFVCPVGFRIPSVGEFLAETAQASTPISNNIEAYESFLKLPSSGLRIGSTGKMRIDGTDAYYMVSGGNYNISVDYFYYSKKSIGKGSLSARVNGMTIRCIKN